MAEILIEDVLSLESVASTSGRLTRLTKGAIAVTGRATASSRARRFRLMRARLNGRATVATIANKYKTIRARISVESALEAFTFDRDIKTEMGDYLPAFYRDIDDVMRMTDVDATEVIRMRAYLDNLLDNFYVNSSENLLARWESEVGIEAIPQRSAEARRNYINAKLRGKGVATADLIKSVVDAFYYAEITDKPRENAVEVKLLGKRGVPRNLEDIDVAVTDVIPAHLVPDYAFTYATWNEMSSVGLRWQEAEDMTMKELEETFYVEPDFPYEE